MHRIFGLTPSMHLRVMMTATCRWSLQLPIRYLTGRLDLSASADIQAMQASGQITLTDINLRPLLFHASFPGGITSEDTHAATNSHLHRRRILKRLTAV
jgi:hypothetical protein